MELDFFLHKNGVYYYLREKGGIALPYLIIECPIFDCPRHLKF